MALESPLGNRLWEWKNLMPWIHSSGGGKAHNDNVIKNKDSAEQGCKALKDYNEKLQIRVIWSQLNTTEESLEKQNE